MTMLHLVLPMTTGAILCLPMPGPTQSEVREKKRIVRYAGPIFLRTLSTYASPSKSLI